MTPSLSDLIQRVHKTPEPTLTNEQLDELIKQHEGVLHGCGDGDRWAAEVADKSIRALVELRARRDVLTRNKPIVEQLADAAERMQGEIGELTTLAKIGTWHKDCRPNRHQAAAEIQKQQATIDKLADTITEKSARVAELEGQIAEIRKDRDDWGQKYWNLRAENALAQMPTGLDSGTGPSWTVATYPCGHVGRFEEGVLVPAECETCAPSRPDTET